jgi:hypothetical protein
MQTWVDYFERLKAHKAARARARRTLLSLLTPEQREQLEQGLGFDVTVNGRRYRIRPGNTVQRLDDATGTFPLYTLCVRPDPKANEWIPEDDAAITQKLLLEADEAAFLETAIRGR